MTSSCARVYKSLTAKSPGPEWECVPEREFPIPSGTVGCEAQPSGDLLSCIACLRCNPSMKFKGPFVVPFFQA